MSGRRLYIGGISSRTRERDIEDVFIRYGRIISIDLKNGFAFLEYDDSRDAEDAVRYLDGTNVDGNRIRVEFSHGGRKTTRDRAPLRGDYRLLVDGVPRDMSWQDLKDVFRKAGDVVFTDVRSDRSGPYGIVEYKYKDDMRQALKELDGYEYRGKRLSVKEDSSSSGGGGSSSRRSRSRSPPRSSKRGRSRSRSRSRSKSRSRSPPRSDSNKDAAASAGAPAAAAKDAANNNGSKDAPAASPPAPAADGGGAAAAAGAAAESKVGEDAKSS